jgi:protein-tyrosine-phosphatase
MSAELCFKKYLADNGITDWKVGSAGILATPEPIDPKTLETLHELGIDATAHTQQKLSRELLDSYDIVVGMAENHIEFMKSEFGYTDAILFNELAVKKETSVTDIDESPDYLTNRPAVEKKIERTVRDISEKIPAVFKNVSDRFRKSACRKAS